MTPESVEKFRKDHPDSLKVAFFMTKFSDEKPYPQIFQALKEVYRENGIQLLRADDKIYHPDLYQNMQTYMHSCGSGIAFFDTMQNEDYNPNVAFEVGYMISLGKPVCLLKNQFNKNLNTDLMGKLYITVNPFEPKESLKLPVSNWLEDNDLCLRCTKCYITIKENMMMDGITQEKFVELDTTIQSLKRSFHSLIFEGISVNHSENTVFKYECSPDFYETIEEYFRNGTLDRAVGLKVLGVSPSENLGYKNYDFVHEISTFQPGSDEVKKIVHVCKLDGIEGHFREKKKAEKLFKLSRTNDINKCEVYITKSGNKFYIHSNYVIANFNYTTKILIYNGHYNLLELLKILVTNSLPVSTHPYEKLIVAHCLRIKYYVNRNMVSPEGQLKIDLDGARNVELVV